MARDWDPEHVVDERAAAELVAAQFPQLAPVRAAKLGEGFDNTAHVVNDRYVFRFPRRARAVSFLRNEMAALPRVAGRVPVAVPAPAFVGRATDAFPWPFVGYAMIAGRSACGAELADGDRAALAAPLGRFLRALHDTPVGDEVGPDVLRRLDVPHRRAIARDAIDELARGHASLDVRPLRRIVDEAADYAPRADTLVHGDLYARHLLVDRDGGGSVALTGVIDWGDVHRGDPAADLMIAHAFLPPPARVAFREAYGPIDEATWAAARFRAAYHTALVLRYAHAVGDKALWAEATRAVTHLTGA